MKKTIKQILLMGVLLILVFGLAGCGNKMVATKTVDENGIKANIRYEILFKKDKVNSIKMSTEYETKEAADAAFKSLQLVNTLAQNNEEDKLDISQDGNKVIIILTGEQFEALSDEEEMTKKEIKTNLEQEGFKVR